ncbi:MAG: ACP S-malonyltransferase [Pyrinomonadaceae bacterium]
MSEKLAYIFPGQGSQYPGMGRDLVDNYPAAAEVFAQADSALGFALSEMCFNGTAEELQLTENTQPAILTVSIAAFRVMEAEGFPVPDYVAGHSLGEYSALVVAGGLGFADAVRTVRLRGQYMQEAVPVGAGAMAAILGAELADVMAACGEARQANVCSPANINSPGQIVIAGDAVAVETAMALLKDRGAKRVVRLNVSAPFHCALMMPAQEQLGVNLDALEFSDLTVPLVSNVDAAEVTSGDAVRDGLIRQVSATVRWQESMELLIANGVERFVEVGPGKVLTGLLRQIKREVRGLNVEDSASLQMAEDVLVTG